MTFYERLSSFYASEYNLSFSASDCVNNIKFLSPLHRKILEYRSQNKSYREIGETFGNSHESCRNIFIGAIHELRRIIMREKLTSLGPKRLLNLPAKLFVEYFIDSPFRSRLLDIVEAASLSTVSNLLGKLDTLRKFRGWGCGGQLHLIEVVKRFWGEEYFLFVDRAVSFVEKREELEVFYGTCFRCDLNAIVGDLQDCILCGKQILGLRPFKVLFSIDTMNLWNLASSMRYDQSAVTSSMPINMGEKNGR